MLKQDGSFPKQFTERTPFEQLEHTMKSSPDYKIPACTMPDSGQEKHGEKIGVCTQFSLAISAQRNIDVVPEPAGQ